MREREKMKESWEGKMNAFFCCFRSDRADFSFWHMDMPPWAMDEENKERKEERDKHKLVVMDNFVLPHLWPEAFAPDPVCCP